ncbi:hypothetical protein KSC_044370 [Ktedonobacter sp. SOSP1-52]|uniref:serine/threonine-protein kinase n=1 Tax=Ktedonobacter sp. SOSP1-52 TaxID=2778366 RepID=UPI00191690BF|nr:serine/threonine-protein kinase [Ktedonobacter sp. SOSP1-52]GHO65545.1 hypothetical protein KSC_044370 [Ktedonobacter sp. SOSP1-52]
MNQRIGTQIGNYNIVDVIARGAYGIVYRAEHIYLHNSAAIKFLHEDLNTSKQQAFFLQEAQMLADLKHSNIVRILDSGIDNDVPYLISEYASGGSLRNYLRKQQPKPLSLQNALLILAHIGRALTYIHSQGIIHRDLKPENILFGKNGQALLADFGIAQMKQATGASKSRSLAGLGTPAYMAPEQFKAKGKPLPESDQYALGCIAYELLTGQLPFTPEDERAYEYQHVYEIPETPRSLNPTLSPRIEQAVLTALAKEPEDRHPSIELFLLALGIHKPAATQFSLFSDARGTLLNAEIDGADSITLVKQLEYEAPQGETLKRQGQMATDQFASTFLRATSPIRATPRPDKAQSVPSSSRTKRTTERAAPAPHSMKLSSQPNALSLWRRVQLLITETPPYTLIKWVFLFVATFDLLLLLCGFWLGFTPLALTATVLAIGLCVCGIALNFFTEPWVWLVVFLLLSPLSGAIYTLAVHIVSVDGGIINWHTYCAYLLFTPGAGFLYGLFGPDKQRKTAIAPAMVKTLTLTIWFLGAGLCIVGIAAPQIIYVGLAWALASAIIAIAQLIRCKQMEWLGAMLLAAAITFGIPILFLGFIYGAFGPKEGEKPENV